MEDGPIAALRKKVLTLTYQCPVGSYAAGCPFAKFEGIGPGTREEVFSKMNREDMLRFFDLSATCQCPVDPRHQPSADVTL